MKSLTRPPRPAKRPGPKTLKLGRPAGFGTVTAYLSVEGGVAALEFYVRAFGAKELMRQLTPDGKLLHGRLQIGDSTVMVSDVFPGAATASPRQLGRTTVTLHIYTDDIDALWARALAAGARVVMPLADMFWGERYGQLVDPFGHHWSIAMPVAMTESQKRAKQAEAMSRFSPA
ncbi:MAG: VOC family protein [Thermoplasmata archaeon]|nr:VOC family protein [Thermoplasmata archaeon]